MGQVTVTFRLFVHTTLTGDLQEVMVTSMEKVHFFMFLSHFKMTHENTCVCICRQRERDKERESLLNYGNSKAN